MGDGVSPDINQGIQNKDRILSSKSPDKSLKDHLGKVTPVLRKAAGKVILGVPALTALVASSDNIHNQIVPEQIGNPPPAVAELSTGMPSANIDLNNIQLPSTPEPTSIASTPSPTETPKPPEYEYLTFGNVKIAIDKEGFPVG